MGENKSITIEGAAFRFEVKSKDGVMHVSLYSGDGESAHAIMTADESKEVVEALDIVRGSRGKTDPLRSRSLNSEVMTGIFGYYLRVYVTANFGEKYDNGVKLMLDSGLLNETAAQCAVICCYVDNWCRTHSGPRQEAFAAAAETFNVAVYTVRHYYYDLKKRYDIFNKNNKDYEKTASPSRTDGSFRPEQEGRDKNDGRD